MKSLLFSVVVFVIGAPVQASVGVPKLNLDFWNKSTSVLWNNNCYNYSTNRVTNSFAQPGEASGEMYEDLTCESVLRAAGKDLGLVETKGFDFKEKSDNTLIALVVAPGYDFHWYRRDDNNLWSHKPGSTEATSKDESGDTIVDPETADRGYYTDFCGYFKITNNIHDEDEQDEGFVRIGDMLELPELESSNEERTEVSELEILLYSGRRNPKMSFETILNSGILSTSNMKPLLVRLKTESPGVMKTTWNSRLGYGGILIHDRQGLVFPKGTTLHVRDNTIIAYSHGRSVAIYDESIVTLEKQLKAQFSASEK